MQPFYLLFLQSDSNRWVTSVQKPKSRATEEEQQQQRRRQEEEEEEEK